jgi:putative peptidoglycan lipid II flippase
VGSGGLLAKAGRATAGLTLATSVGQIAAIGRDLFVAAQVGLSADLDALLLAAAVPIAFAGFLTSGPQTALVAALTGLSSRRGDARAGEFAGAVLTYILLAGAVLTSVVILAASPIVSTVGAGFEEDGRRVAVAYLALLAPILMFSAASGVLTGIQQAAGRFRPLAYAWIAGPVVSMAVTVVLWDRLGLTAYALGMTAGAATTTVVLASMAAAGNMLPPLTLRMNRADRDPFLRHMLPLTGGSALLQVNVLIERMIAAFLSPGAVSALRYGDLVVRAPLYAAGPAWSAVAYSTIARAASDQEDAMGTTAESAVRYGVAIFVPIAVGLAAFAPLVVDILYGRGAFDAEAATLTSVVVIALAPLLAINVVQPVVVSAHNARRRGRFLGALAAANLALTATLSVLLANVLGVVGIAIASSVTAVTLVAVMVASLSRVEPTFSGGRVIRVLLPTVTLSAAIGAPASALAWWSHSAMAWPGDLAVLLLLGLISATTYLWIASRAGVMEVDRVAAMVKRAIMRTRLRAG